MTENTTGVELSNIPGAIPQYNDDGTELVVIATCGTCGKSWNDARISGITPAPAGRCPFEDEHDDEPNPDIYTRRLIVTLPNVSGEEADETASWIERSTDRDIPGTTVTHALGESLPPGVRCYVNAATGDIVLMQERPGKPYDVILMPDATEARQIAGALLAHAHTIENRS